jgi:hypothetical protein
MSESEYYDNWVADGKPWRNARPIAEIAAKLKAARPAAASAGCFGTIGDLAHLLAEPPQDHTPYSQTGWPLPNPYPRITATDITHRPDLGVDCNEIHKHWLASANAGQMPWIKYWIWQGRRYDVRNNFNPVSASGHYDHLHGSQRTDHIETSIGGWHPLPGMGDDMYEQADRNTAHADTWRMLTILENRPAAEYQLLGEEKPRSEPNRLKEQLDRIEAKGGVTLSDADIAAIVAGLKAELAPLIPSAAQIADAVRPVVDSELDEAFTSGADKD